MERSLGIHLRLIPDAAQGVSVISEALSNIEEKLAKLKETAKGFDLAGIQGLNTELPKTAAAADKAATAFSKLDTAFTKVTSSGGTATSVFKDLAASMSGLSNEANQVASAFTRVDAAGDRVSRKVKNVKVDLGDVAKAAAQTANDINKVAEAMAGMDSGGNAGAVRVAETFQVVRREAMSATVAINETRDAILRLPTSRTIQIRQEFIRTGPTMDDFRSYVYRGDTTPRLGGGYGGGALEGGNNPLSLGGGNARLSGGGFNQTALGPGGSINPNIVNVTPGGGGGGYSGGGGYGGYEPPLMLGTGDPGITAQMAANEAASARRRSAQFRYQQGQRIEDSFTNGAYGSGTYDPTQSFGINDDAIPQSGTTQRGYNSGRAGGTSGFGNKGFGDPRLATATAGVVTALGAFTSQAGNSKNVLQSFGNKVSHAGNDAFWGGFSGIMTASLIGGPLVDLGKKATDLDDILAQMKEAFQHGGGTAQSAEKFSLGLQKAAADVGGDFKENMVGAYPFISSLPPLPNGGKIDLNDSKERDAMIGIYKDIMKLNVADTSSAKPTNMYDMTRYVAATAHNLGFKIDDAASMKKAYDEAMNFAVQVKNKTASTAFEAMDAVRQVGNVGVMAGMKPEEIEGAVAILADNKIVGSPAGNQLKRILSRQVLDPAPLAKLQKFASDKSGGEFNLSMYDDQGKQKGLFDLLSQVSKFESKYVNPKDTQTRGMIAGEISGLYAAPGAAALIKFMTENGGDPAALAKYTNSTLRDMPKGYAGKKNADGSKMTPLDATYEIRSDQNVKTAASKVDADFNTELLATFKLLKPEIIDVLHAVDGLIKGFGALPAPIKVAAVNGALIIAAFAGISGIAGVLFGGIAKLIGGFVEFAGGIGAILRGFGLAVPVFETFGELLGIAMPAALRLLTVAFFGVPIVGWIAGIISAVMLLHSAWTGNWFDIQGKTASAVKAVQGFIGQVGVVVGDMVKYAQQGFPRFPYYLGLAFGEAGKIFVNASIAWPGLVGTALVKMLGALAAGTPGFLEAAGKMMAGFAMGIIQGIPNALGAVGNFVHSVVDALGGLWNSGVAAAKDFASGYSAGTDANLGTIKTAQQKVANLHPHSEPKDSSSPLAGQTASGRSYASMFAEGYSQQIVAETPNAASAAAHFADGVQVAYIDHAEFMGIEHSSGKGKGRAKTSHARKGRAPASDTMIELPVGETIAQIEEATRKIEAALEESGHIIRKKMVDIYDPKTGKASSFEAVPAAVHMAIRGGRGGKDDTYERAREIADPALNAMRLGNFNPGQVNRVVAEIKGLETKSASAEVVRKLNDLVTNIEHAAQVAEKRIVSSLHINVGMNRLDQLVNKDEIRETTRFSNVQQRDDQHLQNLQALQKDPDKASPKELAQQQAVMLTEAQNLNSVLRDEQTIYGQINTQIDAMVASLGKLNQNDPAQKRVYDDTIVKIRDYKENADALNMTMETQGVTISKLKSEVKAYGEEIVDAKNKSEQFGALLSESFSRGLSAASDVLSKEGGDIMDKFMGSILGRRSVQSTNIFQQMINAFLKNAITNATSSLTNSLFSSQFGGLMGDNSITDGNKKKNAGGVFSQIFGGLFGGSNNKSSVPQSKDDDTTATNTTTISKTLSSTDKTTTAIAKSADDTQTNTKSIDDSLKKILDQNDSSEHSSSPSAAHAANTPGAPGSTSGGGSSALWQTPSTGSAAAGPTNINDIITQTTGIPSSNLQHIEGEAGGIISGGAAVIGGYQTGGFGGAVSGFMGTEQVENSIAPGFGFTPVGLGISAAVGITEGLIHHDDPSKMPDKYNTQAYGQGLADLTGKNQGANGTSFTMSAQTAQLTNGQGLVSYIEEQLAAGKPAYMTDQQYQTYIKEFGSSASGGGKVNSEKDIANEYITGGGASGEVKNYATLDADAQNFLKADQAAIQAQLQQQNNANQLASSFTSMALNGISGFIMPSGGLQGTGGGVGSLRSGILGGGSMPAGTSPLKTTLAPTRGDSSVVAPIIHVHVLEGAKIDSGPQIEQALNDALPKLQNQLNNMNFNNYRYRGGYTSATV